MSVTDFLSEPPASAAEPVVLGSLMLLTGSQRGTVLSRLGADHFHTEAGRITFKAIAQLHERSEPADPVSVLSELQRQGVVSSWPTPAASVGNYLHDCVGTVPVPLAYAPAVRAVLEASFRRRVHQTALRLCQASGTASFDGLVDLVSREMAGLSGAMDKSVSG